MVSTFLKRGFGLAFQAVSLALVTTFWMGPLAGRTLAPIPQPEASETTRMARQLLLEKLAAIAENSQCRGEFARKNIDLAKLRSIVVQTRFYNSAGLEGDLRFSVVVGKPASPDQTLRTLAMQVGADAFVLGYVDDGRYVRTNRVVLGRGYFEQRESQPGVFRPTTLEEKKAILLHELLHIALGKGDDYLDRQELCPLALLFLCPRFLPDRRSSGSRGSAESNGKRKNRTVNDCCKGSYFLEAKTRGSGPGPYLAAYSSRIDHRACLRLAHGSFFDLDFHSVPANSAEEPWENTTFPAAPRRGFWSPWFLVRPRCHLVHPIAPAPDPASPQSANTWISLPKTKFS